MAVTLEKIKQYLRIDSNYEDELISSFIPVAAAYLKAAVTDYDEKYQSDEAFAEEADFLQMLLVGEMYQNRDGRNDPRNDYSYAVRSMITQLQYWVSVPTTYITMTAYTTIAMLGDEPP